MHRLSRQTLVGLEAGTLSDLGFKRVAQVLAVLGLGLDPPSQATRARQRSLWMAAKSAGLSYVQEVPPETVGHALAGGSVPKGYAAQLTHLFDETPVPLVVMAVEEAAARKGVAAKAVWHNVVKRAKSLGVHRQGLWASLHSGGVWTKIHTSTYTHGARRGNAHDQSLQQRQ